MPGHALFSCPVCLAVAGGPGFCRLRGDVSDPSPPSFGHGRGEGSEAVSPVAIVWPCSLPVDEYVAAGRDLEFPRPGCPSCAGPMTFWSGYRRWVRDRRGCRRVFVPRLRCGACRVSHALLPAFVLARRLDTAGTIGGVLAAVAAGRCGVRPAAERAGVAHTTARGWWRRFAARAPALGAGFAALAVELGGEAFTPPEGAARFAAAEAPSVCTRQLHLVSGSEQIGQLGATDAICLIRSEGVPNEPCGCAPCQETGDHGARRGLQVSCCPPWRPGWLAGVSAHRCGPAGSRPAPPPGRRCR